MLQRHSHVEAAELLVATTDAIEGEVGLHPVLCKPITMLNVLLTCRHLVKSLPFTISCSSSSIKQTYVLYPRTCDGTQRTHLLASSLQNMRKIVLTEMEQRIYDRRELTPGSSERRWTTDEVFAVLSHGIQALQVLHRPEKRNNNNAPVAISALRSNLKTELTMMMERAVADELIAQRADGSRELATAQDQSAPRLLHRFLSSL